MSIEVITMWYNEVFLAPFFLNHYRFADHIRVIDDEETTDNTKEIVSKYPNATLQYIKFPDKFDNNIAVDWVNKYYTESKADWVIVVDADEFVLTPNLPEFLKDRKEDIFYVRLYEVYRNMQDTDLDPSIPIIEQRRHGDARAVKGVNRRGMKPIIVRTGHRIRWLPGQHRLVRSRHTTTVSKEVLLGTHWMLADTSRPFIERRLRGNLRQSQANILHGHSIHCNDVTEEKIVMHLREHLNDGRLF